MILRRYRHCRPDLLLETVGADRALFLELAQIFLRESVTLGEQLHLAAAGADEARLGHASHALKGTVGPLGADTLVRVLLDMEEECARFAYVRDPRRLAVIDVELAGMRREMTHFIANF